MTAIQNLNTAVTNIQAEVAADLAALGSLPNNDAAIQAAADAINAEISKLAAARGALSA